MRTANPALRDAVFREAASEARAAGAAMTIQGTLVKTSVLLLLVTASATFTWQKAMQGGASVMPWLWGGLLVGLGLALAISFKPKLASTLSVPYALAEGLFLGVISAMYATRFGAAEAGGLASGIVFQAVALTFGTAFAMLALYAFRIIRVTQRLRSIVLAATGGIMLFYVLSMVLGLFGVSVPLLHSSGPFGIGISLVIVGVAAFNLLLDFDLIERGQRGGAPKYMEWFGAFALVVTLIWLYIEMLRLLAKLQSRD